MKVTVTERKFTLPIAGIEHTLTEQDARELWASLNEHFGVCVAALQPRSGSITISPVEQWKRDIHWQNLLDGAGLDCNT